ncbi:hypothetical protein LX32DRAFT_658502 [Colletotrichum zoysiae]|uniref:Uncharacterized protein n=1 Tax=Colletotrichum zoysiae TaxID=1216348 RepID=A0AAD9H2N9_9PEZI|nr:hypothetical protein LX32DRAFT_658502 [Colletotrichum zoysiae]
MHHPAALAVLRFSGARQTLYERDRETQSGMAFPLVFSGNQTAIVQVYGPSLDASLSLGRRRRQSESSSNLNATGSPSKKWGSSRVRHPCGGDQGSMRLTIWKTCDLQDVGLGDLMRADRGRRNAVVSEEVQHVDCRPGCERFCYSVGSGFEPPRPRVRQETNGFFLITLIHVGIATGPALQSLPDPDVPKRTFQDICPQ